MFLCPEGEEQHNTTHPHYTLQPPLPASPAAIKRNLLYLQCQRARWRKCNFSSSSSSSWHSWEQKAPSQPSPPLPTLPSPPPQQINFPAAPHPGSHGYPVRLHVPISKSQLGGKGRIRDARFKALFSPSSPHPPPPR